MNRDEARDAVQRWQQAGAALEMLHDDALRRFSHAENAAAIDDLLTAGLLHAQPRVSSGIIEMQQFLARARP